MFNSTQEIIDDIKLGKMVVLLDDEDRENEGDLVIAADFVSKEHINFMAQYGRGLICLPLVEKICKQLNLSLMVDDNNSRYSTNFTLSIEAASGITTGISAEDRAKTVKAAIDRNAGPSSVVQPGHIFPILAKNGGVLKRAGHTEASTDLASLANLTSAAVICEILNVDGTMARRDELFAFAKEHNLKIGTIANLIEYRLQTETTVSEVTSGPLETKFGNFTAHVFKENINSEEHLVLTCKDKTAQTEPLVRVISKKDSVYDLPGVRAVHWRNPQRWPLDAAMQKIAQNGNGAIVIMGHKSSNESIIENVGMLGAVSNTVVENTKSLGDMCEIGVGSQILSQLGFNKFKILDSAKKWHAISGFGIEITGNIPYKIGQEVKNATN